MRTHRGSWKTYILGIAVTAALLSTAACDADGADDKAGGTPSGSAGAATPGAPGPSAAPEATGTPAPTGTARSGDGTGPSRAPGNDPSAGGPKPGHEPCDPTAVRITTSVERMDSVKHLILTATNAGGRSCTLYRYPEVVFGDGSHPFGGPMESKPASPALLAPGEKAYAGVLLWRVGEQLDQVTSLSVSLLDPDTGAESGRPIALPMPTGAPFVDVGPNPLATFWNRDLRAVQKFTFAR
ncbi:DUF4232 domain-containing protein [Streptomyces sp. NPDC089919]|uniref:DUF4232 domain-containing protein n=1 Tax=Streptomyces sp. NPDC089919 TaxID=3155188 RepID=UPI00341CBAAA